MGGGMGEGGGKELCSSKSSTGTLVGVALGGVPRDGAERVWAFPSATMPS